MQRIAEVLSQNGNLSLTTVQYLSRKGLAGGLCRLEMLLAFPGVAHPPEVRVISPIQSHERSSHLPELSEVPQQPTQPPKPVDLNWVYVKDSLKWETPLELRPASSTRPCHKLARAIHTTKKTRSGCRQAARKVESLPSSKESKYSAISSRALSFYLLLMGRSCRASRAFAGSILSIRM